MSIAGGGQTAAAWLSGGQPSRDDFFAEHHTGSSLLGRAGGVVDPVHDRRLDVHLRAIFQIPRGGVWLVADDAFGLFFARFFHDGGVGVFWRSSGRPVWPSDRPRLYWDLLQRRLPADVAGVVGVANVCDLRPVYRAGHGDA